MFFHTFHTLYLRLFFLFVCCIFPQFHSCIENDHTGGRVTFPDENFEISSSNFDTDLFDSRFI